MAKYPKIREQNIAVFGQSGSGKTVLLSSFFGRTQDSSFTNDLWDLVAVQVGQGHRLYQNYLGMRDESRPPLPGRFASVTYQFSVKLKTGSVKESEKRPFDELRLAWHDYPGEWFTEDPSSSEERTRRIDTWKTLLKSDVAMILVDGHKLREYQGEEERYLKSLFGNLRQNILSIKDDLLADDGPLVEFPRIWILALSKADLLPDYDVEKFRDLVILKSADDIELLRSDIQSLIQSPKALSIGDDFVLLSSAEFRSKTGSVDTTEIDVSKRIGVDLILPIASLVPLERRVKWEQEMDLPRRVAEKLADGSVHLAEVINGSGRRIVERFARRAFKGNQKAMYAVNYAVPVIIAEAAHLAGTKLKEVNEQARAQHDHLRAALTQFKLDLENARTARILRTEK